MSALGFDTRTAQVVSTFTAESSPDDASTLSSSTVSRVARDAMSCATTHAESSECALQQINFQLEKIAERFDENKLLKCWRDLVECIALCFNGLLECQTPTTEEFAEALTVH